MTGLPDDNRGGKAVLIAIATAIAGFVPAANAYDIVSRWLRPMRHAEEAMGRGLEVLFFGGPITALAFAAIIGWCVYRSTSRATMPMAIVLIAFLTLSSLVMAHLGGLF